MDLHLKSLLAVFLLAAVATAAAVQLPAAKDLAALGLLLDLVPVAGAMSATAVMTIQLRRANVTLIALLIAGYCCFAGALVGTLGMAHLVAVIAEAMKTSGEGEFVYDFRTYSLIQLGMALVGCGFFAALLAARLSRGQHSAWRISLVIWSVILLINLPLVPLQGFAVLFSILAALGVLALYAMRYFIVKIPVRDPERSASA